MREFYSSVNAEKKWENFLDSLVKIGLVTVIKPPVKVKGINVSSSEYDLEKVYQLFIKPHGLDEGGRTNVRLWRDERKTKNGFIKDSASVKFSDKGLDAILNSITVASILAKHNIALIDKNGKVDLKALAAAARLIDKDIEAIEKIEPGKFVVKTKDK